MGDIVGRLFREFAVTLGVTILVSACVSLTLTPMMCAKLLHASEARSTAAFIDASENFVNGLIAAYDRTLQVVLRHQTVTLLVTVGTLILTIVLFYYVPKVFSRCRIPA